MQLHDLLTSIEGVSNFQYLARTHIIFELPTMHFTLSNSHGGDLSIELH